MATPLPKNRAAFSLAEIVLATGAEAPAGSLATQVLGVSTDSRTIAPGDLFVALIGESFDGHDHVAAAAAAEAAAVMISRPIAVPSGVIAIRVPDTLQALGALGRAHKRRWAGRGARRVVGITGSAGKTTTRHVTTAVLAALGRRVHASAGNLNNAVGVPHVLFGLDDIHEDAVIEIGMNTPGEIASTTALVEPDAAVITLVSDAHTQGVGSIWGVAREKSDILAALDPNGVAVVNADCPGSRAALVRTRARRQVLYGRAADADVRLVSRSSLGLRGSLLEVAVRREGGANTRLQLPIPLLGEAGAMAALAAIAVAVGLDPASADRAADLAAGLAAAGSGEGGRLAPQTAPDKTIVIDDAYNANPASMHASIGAAREIADAEGRGLVLVLGVMRELGAQSAALHEAVGRAAAAAKPSVLVVVSPDAEPMAAAAEAAGTKVARFADAAAAADGVLGLASPGDVVLVKASNSLRLSRVAARLAERQ